MRGKRWSVAVCVAWVLAAAPVSKAAVPYVEDLSGCSLPNGIVSLPAAGAKTDLLKVSSGTLVALPAASDGTPYTGEALLIHIRAGKLADLRYLPEVNGNGGTFWAISGRISDLGGRYLSQAAAMNASAPMEIPATSRGPAGMHPGLAEGHTYLVQTTDDHFALVRILEKTADRVVIQYVYQPSGTVAFDVPESDKLAFQSGAGAPATRPGAAPGGSPAVSAPSSAPGGTVGMSGAGGTGGAGGIAGGVVGRMPPATMSASASPAGSSRTGLGPRDVYEPGENGRIVLLNSGASNGPAVEPALESLIRQRELMIQNRLAVAQAAARSPQEVDRKAQAISDLAALHAEEAADVLVAQVSFLNSRGASREVTPDALHPAYAALKKLGKPASSAALRGLAAMTNVDDQGEGLESPWYKAGLLMGVIRAVEGEDVAEFLLRRDMEKVSDPRQRALYEHLLGKK
jgi:hypothetical protein